MADGVATSEMSNDTYDANNYVVATPPMIVATQSRNAETPVDTSSVSTQAWLIKVPKFVKEKWDEVAASGVVGADLGSIRIYQQVPVQPPQPNRGPQGAQQASHVSRPMKNTNPNLPMALPPSGQQKEAPQQRVSLHLPRDAPWVATLPKDYNLKLTSIDTKDAFVFTTPPQQDSVSSFAASVVHEATVTPIMNEEYKSIMKLRQEAESKKRKSVFVIGEKESRNLRRVQSTMGGNISGSITNISKAEAARVTGRFKDLEKRERMERQDLINILIMAFNEHEYWSFKDLGNRTKQPAAWLKEVLGDIAQIVKGGTYNGLYELKAVLKDVGGSGEGEGNDLDRKDEI